MAALVDWCSQALHSIEDLLPSDHFWADRLRQIGNRRSAVGIHLAVLVEPFLAYILEGTKTVESRFSVRRSAPYGYVRPGDLVLLKAASGPVVGICLAERVWTFELTSASVTRIRAEFGMAMRADEPGFWEKRQAAAFATLMEVKEPRELPQALPCPKRDRRGWVVLRSGQREMALVGAP